MKHNRLLPNAVAALWGFAESTAFFIVPDVFITYRALKGYKAALLGSLYGLGGALIGGVLMFVWAQHSSSALHFVQHVPAITAPMVTTANSDYAHHGVVALLVAPLKGIPYKLYTVIAPQYGVGIMAFMAVSVIARFGRFIVTSVVTAALSAFLGRWISYKQRLAILIGFWFVFYCYYFYLNG